MKRSVEVKNLCVENVFDNVNLDFYNGLNTFICGGSASGKTSLLKCINGNMNYKGDIIKGNVGVIFSSFSFEKDKVSDEIRYLLLSKTLQNLVLKLFGNKLSVDPRSLSYEDQILVAIIKELSKKINVIFIDNLLSFVSYQKKELLLSCLLKSKLDLVLVSNDIEDALYFDYMIVMNNGSVAIEGDTKEVLKEERVLKRLGIGLPFYVDLSFQLQLYGLIDEVYLNKEELVGALWK